MPDRRMGLQHIETFRAVVMTGSMTKAADQLHTSQPQVSRLIGQLEEIIKFPLFIRRGTRITTSVEGGKFFEEVEKSYVGLANLESAANNIRLFKSEHLRVAAMPRLAGGLLSKAVAALKLDYPSAMVSIHSGSAPAVHSWISSGTCDVAMAMVYGKPTRGAETVSLLTAKCVCILPRGHRLCSKEYVTPSDLSGEDFITYTPGSSLRLQIDAFFKNTAVLPLVVAETDLGASACALVAAGLGASLINPLAAREETLNADMVVKPIKPDLLVTLALVFPLYRQKSRIVERFEVYARSAIARELEKFRVG